MYIEVKSNENVGFEAPDTTGSGLKEIRGTLDLMGLEWEDNVVDGKTTYMYSIDLALKNDEEYRLYVLLHKAENELKYHFVSIAKWSTSGGHYEDEEIYWSMEEAVKAMMELLANKS